MIGLEKLREILVKKASLWQNRQEGTLIQEFIQHIKSLNPLQASFPAQPIAYKGYLCFGVIEDMPVIQYLYRYDKTIDWEEALRVGKIKVFNAFIGLKYQLKCGDMLLYAKETSFAEPPVTAKINILYEDRYLLVFNKPAHLPCHPSGAYFKHSFSKILAAQGITCHLIHRLDLETSGVLIAVKMSSHVVAFSQALRTGQKVYRVLVYGHFPDDLKVTFPLGQKEGSVVRKKQGRNDTCGKTSITHFHKDGEYTWNDTTYSLLSAYPLTGRTHQIRAHLVESGFPVVGDKIYGREEEYFLTFLQAGLTPALLADLELSRHFLHAASVSFCHPMTHHQMIFNANIADEPELANLFTTRHWGQIPSCAPNETSSK